ncbi:MAG TPA: hypothetical protein VIW24_31375 [Aldersonia sp.]
MILAVHQAASGPDRPKWKYRNVIGIGATKVSDLPLDDGADRPVAGIAVTQRGVTANVTFRVADDVATAHFCGAASRADLLEESAWASFLATGTVDVLARDGVDTHVDPA